MDIAVLSAVSSNRLLRFGTDPECHFYFKLPGRDHLAKESHSILHSRFPAFRVFQFLHEPFRQPLAVSRKDSSDILQLKVCSYDKAHMTAVVQECRISLRCRR